MNTEGLLIDIHEDSGYDRWDLTLTVLEQITKDVKDFLDSGEDKESVDKDHLYALINLIDIISEKDLHKFLPKGNGIYLPEVCGDFRIPFNEWELPKEE